MAVFLPSAISGRLDCLLRAADEGHERTSRRELLAALVLAAPVDARELASLLSSYREARVGDAFVEGQPPELVVAPWDTPGPRQQAVLSFQLPPGLPNPVETSKNVSNLPTYRVGSAVPRPVRERLDEMLSGLEDEDTDRDELLAAIILNGPEPPPNVAQLIANYRRSSADEATQTGRRVDRARRRRHEGPSGQRRYRR